MKFDAQGVHLWTRQRGGKGSDEARALQADGVRLRFRIFSMEEKHGKTLDPLARSMFWVRWNGITVCGSIFIFVPLKKVILFASRIGKNMNSIDALSLVSLSPSHRLDAPGTWSSISTRYYLIFKDYSKSSIWHSIPTHACNALKDEYLIHSHFSHCLRMFIWVTWYIYWLTDWWLMRFDENCWQTVFRLKLNLASEHRTRTEPPYANLIKTLCTLSCKMCKSKLKQHCQILPAYKDMKLETTLSDRLRWVVFIRIHWISRSCPDTVGHAVDISWLCGVMLTSWRRWTTLAMPGWQAPRKAPWMAIPTRARMTSSWWNSMPRACTCGRASAVVRAMTVLTLCRRTGCDFVFESFPWRKNMEKL